MSQIVAVNPVVTALRGRHERHIQVYPDVRTHIARGLFSRSRTRLVRCLRLDPGRHRRNSNRHAASIAEGATALAGLHQHYREYDGHCAARLPEREAMALGRDGDALDRGRYAGSSQRFPKTEGSQAASSITCCSGSSPKQKLTRRSCSPSQRRLTSISAATASQCSTNGGTSPRRHAP